MAQISWSSFIDHSSCLVLFGTYPFIYIYSWLQAFRTNTKSFTTKAFEIAKHSSYTHKSNNFRLMGFRLPGIIKRAANQTSSKGVDMPKGYLAVYVGEKMKRFVIPISYLNQPSFQELLNQAEEQFGYDHPTGGLTIPCREQVFLDITSHLNLC
jgi:SAUR family protein